MENDNSILSELTRTGHTLICENGFSALFQSGVYLIPEAEEPSPIEIVFKTVHSDSPYLCIGSFALDELDIPEAIYKRFGEKFGCRYSAVCWTKEYHSVDDMDEMIAFLNAIAQKNLEWRSATGKTAEHICYCSSEMIPPRNLITLAACDKARKPYTPQEDAANRFDYKLQTHKTMLKVIFHSQPIYFIMVSHLRPPCNTIYDNNGRFIAFRCMENAFRFIGFETVSIEWNADIAERFILGKETSDDIAELTYCYSICESLSGISADNADDTASEEQLLCEDRARVWLRITAKEKLQAFPDAEVKETVIRIMSTGMQTFMNVLALTDIDETEAAPYPDIPDDVIREALKNRTDVSDAIKKLHSATGIPEYKIREQIRRYMKTVMKIH